MSEFTDEIERKASDLRERIHQARENDNEFLAEQLIAELESVEAIAKAHDLDTSGIQKIIAQETGQIPIIHEDTFTHDESGTES